MKNCSILLPSALKFYFNLKYRYQYTVLSPGWFSIFKLSEVLPELRQTLNLVQ